MAKAIYADRGMTSALLYSPMSEGLAELISDMNDRAGRILGETSRRFRERASDYRRRIGFERLSRVSDRIRRSMENFAKTDTIYEIEDIDDVVYAKSKMRRWLMANPNVRRRYRNKQLSGWENTVSDDQTYKPEEHPDYLYVTEGVLIDDTYRYTYSTDLEMLKEEVELSYGEKADILRSWDYVDYLLEEEKIDPTSKWLSVID